MASEIGIHSHVLIIHIFEFNQVRISISSNVPYMYLYHTDPGRSRERVALPPRACLCGHWRYCAPPRRPLQGYDICTIPAGGRQCLHARTTDLEGATCSHARAARGYGGVYYNVVPTAHRTANTRTCTLMTVNVNDVIRCIHSQTIAHSAAHTAHQHTAHRTPHTSTPAHRTPHTVHQLVVYLSRRVVVLSHRRLQHPQCQPPLLVAARALGTTTAGRQCARRNMCASSGGTRCAWLWPRADCVLCGDATH